MAAFLLKSEPSTYSFDDLLRDKKTRWDGISNPAALIAIRSMKPGDSAFFYHTSDFKAIVGLVSILTAAYEDPNHPGKNDRGEPKAAVIDIAPLKPARKPVTLADLKADARFKDFALIKQSRLSAMPVPDPLAKIIKSLAGL